MDDQGGVSAAGVSIGEAAARLGITTSTLRSWGSRYGVVPSLRTAGGHRRYSAADLVVLDQLADYIERDLEARRSVKSALTYPVIICVMAVVTIVVTITRRCATSRIKSIPPMPGMRRSVISTL